MNYTEKLKAATQRFGGIICMGLDPVLEDIPEKCKPGQCITRFYREILDRMVRTSTCPAAVKPNYAFYAQYGIEGIEALVEVIGLYRGEGIPVILDVKRGDIGKTAEAYATEAFDFFKADAVTLSPYMGYDSIAPFIKKKPDGGFYILTKTSNKSSGDLQDIDAGGEPLYMRTAQKIVQWHASGVGSVVGATYPQQLAAIAGFFIASGREVPLLIPGVGTQGGDLAAVIGELKKFPDMAVHRINSSSAINFAYKKYTDLHYADAAVRALKEMNDDIERLRGE
jgi:orotidine-5'-phosphate decarboxylase